MMRATALIGATAAALALAACGSLIPKDKAALYRFGQGVMGQAPAAAPSPAGEVGVLRTGGQFQREAAGDKILTVAGGTVAYIAETRWAAPAAVMWEQAVAAAFDADPGRARLISRGEPGSASYVLRLDVRNFETQYDQGPKAAPQVVVRVRALMSRGTGGGQVTEQVFEAKVRAADNRVSAIVPAYDKAVAEVLAGIVPWVNEQAAPVG